MQFVQIKVSTTVNTILMPELGLYLINNNLICLNCIEDVLECSLAVQDPRKKINFNLEEVKNAEFLLKGLLVKIAYLVLQYNKNELIRRIILTPCEAFSGISEITFHSDHICWQKENSREGKKNDISVFFASSLLHLSLQEIDKSIIARDYNCLFYLNDLANKIHFKNLCEF